MDTQISRSMSSTWSPTCSYGDSRCIKRIKVTTALWVSPSQVFRQTVQLCRLCWSAPDPGAQRAAQEPRQLLEHLLHPEPPQVRRWQEVQHLLGAGQRSVQLHTTYWLMNNMIGTVCSKNCGGGSLFLQLTGNTFTQKHSINTLTTCAFHL